MPKNYENSCIHFRGIQHATCEAGIDWRALTGGENTGIATRMPCLKDNGSEVACPSLHFYTPEEAAAREAETQAHMERSREDMEIIGAAHKNPSHQGPGGQSAAYVCELCERATRHVSATAAAASQHAQEAHGITQTEIVAARGQMAAHMDAAEWFQNDDRFTLADGRALLIRSTRTPRRGSDKAIWRDNVPSGKRRR